jgi:hypothetical protein
MSRSQRSPAIRPGFVLSDEADLEEVLAAGFENATKARKKPEFLPTLPFDNPPQGRSMQALKRVRQPNTQLERPERPLMI